jgi:hypothetical protein
MAKPKTLWLEIEVPEWAQWMAQDADGEWMFYEERPTPTGTYHPEEGVPSHWQSDGVSVEIAFGPKPRDWTRELWSVY